MMNIEEERMAFEGYVLSLSKYKKRSPKFIFDLDENGDYDNQDIYELHHAWQASANREGFVLVKKDLIQSLHQSCNNALDINDRDIYKGLCMAIIDDAEAMIEAQEQSNESD